MPWSKSMNIARSAITHSRPIDMCWNAEIVHSWPITVFAPHETTPSWARLLVPWPLQLEPRRLADLEHDARADEAEAVELHPAPVGGEEAPAQQADDQLRVLEAQHVV